MPDVELVNIATKKTAQVLLKMSLFLEILSKCFFPEAAVKSFSPAQCNPSLGEEHNVPGGYFGHL